MDLAVACYAITDAFPAREQFGLTSQLRRAAVSIPSNIAEGHGRSMTGEYLHHLAVAHGSLMELETQVMLAQRLGYIDVEAAGQALSRSGEVGRMLHGLMRSLRAVREQP
jgi:four helix bundle protein